MSKGVGRGQPDLTVQISKQNNAVWIRGAASGKKIVARMEFGASYMVRMGREGQRMPFPGNRVSTCVAATSGRKLHSRIHFDTAAESISITVPLSFHALTQRLRHRESEYATSMATKKLPPAATYFVS